MKNHRPIKDIPYLKQDNTHISVLAIRKVIFMVEVLTANGDRYMVLGQRVLKNDMCLRLRNCPVAIWAGSCKGESSVRTEELTLGYNFCIQFKSGLYIGDKIVEVRTL